MSWHGGSNSVEQVEDENPYWISFSDMMAGLLILFVLACLVLILELTETKTNVNEKLLELEKAETVRSDVLTEVRRELEKLGIKIQESESNAVLHIPTDELSFRTGSYRIPESARGRALSIGEILFERLSIGDRTEYLDTVFVEGHTDSRPWNKGGGNWALSSRRSISLWQLWEEGLPEGRRLSGLKNHSDQALFSVSGYSDTRRRIEEALDDADHEKNRRIDVRITVKRPTVEDLRGIQSEL